MCFKFVTFFEYSYDVKIFVTHVDVDGRVCGVWWWGWGTDGRTDGRTDRM